MALCPAHPDKNPSLSIREANDKILIHCLAGCKIEDILFKVGLAMRDLFKSSVDQNSSYNDTPVLPPEPAQRTRVVKKKWLSLEIAEKEFDKLPFARDDEQARIFFQKDYGLPASFLPDTWRVFNYKKQTGIVYKGIDPEGKTCSFKWKSIRRGMKDKRSNIFLYGGGGALIFQTEGKNVPLVIVGGEEKALAAYVAGFSVLSPLFGEKALKNGWIKFLLACPQSLILANDNDKTGQKANVETAQILEEKGYDVSLIRLVKWPEGFDAGGDLNHVLKDSGIEGVRALLDNAKPYECKRLHIPPELLENLNEDTDAKRLVYLYGEKIRYCHPWKRWFIYDGVRWKEDQKGQINEFAKKSIWILYDCAENEKSQKKQEEIITYATKRLKKYPLESIMFMAQSEAGIPILPEDFDKNHWLLNVENSTVDLQTGSLREHKNEDYITKLCPV